MAYEKSSGWYQTQKSGVKENKDHLTLTKEEMGRLNKFLRRRERFETNYCSNRTRMSKQEAMEAINGR